MTLRAVVLFAILIALGLFLFADKSDARDFYQWVDVDGIHNFTDVNLAQKGGPIASVPEAYRSQVERRSFDELDFRFARATKTTTTESVDSSALAFERLRYLRVVNADLMHLGNPNLLTDCTGPVTITSARVQEGDHNRRLYTTTDECGRVVSVTSTETRVQILR